MVTSELEKVRLSNGGHSRTAAARSGVEFRNGSQLRPFLPIFATISPDKSLLEAETPLLQLRTVARSDHVGGSIIEADFEKNPTF